MRREPSLTGRTYGEALDAYALGIAVGLRRADGAALVNPPMDTVVESEAQLIVPAEDDLLTQPAYGVVLKPDRTAPLTLSADDRVIVLAEH